MKRILAIYFLVLISFIAAYSQPKISFFVELKGVDQQKLFSDLSLISDLKKMKSSVRLGLLDFSPDCTQTVQQLNNAGIPVYAWLLLPEEDGYWFHMKNGEKALKRYADFKQWTAENNLKWKGIGIDLELDFQDARMMVKHPVKLIWRVYKRLYEKEPLEEGRKTYEQLVNQIRRDGYYLESYVIPTIYDERIAGTTSFQKAIGLIDIKTPNEIPMLYTSMFNNPSIIPSYYQKGQPIALGTAGGGVTIEGMKPKALTWDNLQRDILISTRYSSEVIIFCLEAVVENGWLANLKNFDYSVKPPTLADEQLRQKKIRENTRLILKILDHPFWMTVGIFMVLTIILSVIVKIILSIIRIFRRKQMA